MVLFCWGLTPNFQAFRIGEIKPRPLLIALGWTIVALIIWLSLTPSPPSLDIGFQHADKLGHGFAYAAAMFWFAQLYARTPVRAAYAIGFAALGIVLEFVQAHVGRDFELADMAADAVGVALGWGAALLVSFRFFRR